MEVSHFSRSPPGGANVCGHKQWLQKHQPEFNSGEQRLPTHSCAATSLTSVLELDSRKENEVLRGFWMNTHIALSRKCK